MEHKRLRHSSIHKSSASCSALLKESEAREADQQAREADRQLLRDGLTAVVTGLAHAFKKRKRLNMDNGADDDRDSS